MLSLPHKISIFILYFCHQSGRNYGLFFQDSSTFSLVLQRCSECSCVCVCMHGQPNQQKARKNENRHTAALFYSPINENFLFVQNREKCRNETFSLHTIVFIITFFICHAYVPLQFRVDSLPLHCCMWVGNKLKLGHIIIRIYTVVVRVPFVCLLKGYYGKEEPKTRTRRKLCNNNNAAATKISTLIHKHLSNIIGFLGNRKLNELRMYLYLRAAYRGWPTFVRIHF